MEGDKWERFSEIREELVALETELATVRRDMRNVPERIATMHRIAMTMRTLTMEAQDIVKENKMGSSST